MARIAIDGINIEYELLGAAGAPAIALTPGGRFAKDSVGLPELAQALVAGGRRVLLWDRPNCGASDISFDGDRSEEHTSELQSLMRISYAVFCLKKKKNKNTRHYNKNDKYTNTLITHTKHKYYNKQ